MLYSDYWGALACHSGDMGFESLFMGDFPKSVMQLEKNMEGYRIFSIMLNLQRKLVMMIFTF